MKKNDRNLTLLCVIFSVCLVISNVVTGKVVDTGIPFMGSTITVAGAVFIYWITFLITDVVSELWGKKEAHRVVMCGFVAQCLASLLILITQFTPAVDPTAQDAYMKLLGQNWVFFIGSMTAYFISQNWDVHVFHKIRDAWLKHGGNTTARALWNCGSTMTSQILDTVIFIGIAFGIGSGMLFDSGMWGTLAGMMVGQYLVKLISSILDTPFFYLLTRKREEKTLDTALVC